MTLDYLRLTGRDEAQVAARRGVREGAGTLPHGTTPPDPSTRRPSSSISRPSSRAWPGPKRPQDRVSLRQSKLKFEQALEVMLAERKPKPAAAAPAARPAPRQPPRPWRTATTAPPGLEGLDHGSVVVAAITSCTNTSNPSVMIGAGLLARNAVKRGLTTKPWVKTSLAPGSLVVTEYLQGGGPARVSRRARLQHRRLRLHDVHRQQRPAARAGVERSSRTRTSWSPRC